METMLQRGGRCGRSKELTGEVVVLAQDSMFDDSQEGKKRAQKVIKTEEPMQSAPKPGKKAKLAAGKKDEVLVNSKLKRTPKQYTEAMYSFINTTGCRVEVIDREFDNPPRPEGGVCHCDSHRLERGEPTLQERMRAL